MVLTHKVFRNFLFQHGPAQLILYPPPPPTATNNERWHFQITMFLPVFFRFPDYSAHLGPNIL
jgi:hypothetical protein